jgi:hypothetical protein
MKNNRAAAVIVGLWILATDVNRVMAQTPSNFVAVPPCRIVDTRLPAGPFGGPSMAGNSTRSFPIPSSSCSIPANASAYSLNVTLAPPGVLWVVELWPTGQAQPLVSTMNDPAGQLLANAAIVPAGTSGAVSVWVSNQTDIILDINGYFLPAPIPASQSTAQSTAFGAGASNAGGQNTAIGFNALQVNNTGNGNTASGAFALANNTTGSNNVGIGMSACWALARMGARVLAVDKAPLAPAVARLPQIAYRAESAFALDPRALGPVDWLFCDVVCYPARLLRLVERWLAAGNCRNFVCTIKFQGATDHAAARRFAAIPGGELRHLFHNKHELTWSRIG